MNRRLKIYLDTSRNSCFVELQTYSKKKNKRGDKNGQFPIQLSFVRDSCPTRAFRR